MYFFHRYPRKIANVVGGARMHIIAYLWRVYIVYKFSANAPADELNYQETAKKDSYSI